MGDSERFIDDERKTSNGCPVAKRVSRTAANFRVPSRNVAAIDFGTTNCSVAYLTASDDPKLGPQRLSLNSTYQRVPTAILFKGDGKFVSFGHEARNDYLALDDSERLDYYYFEEIKMILQLDEDVSREMTVNAANGKKFYLVDVIAQILKHLKNELIESLRRAGHPLQVTDFDWVITVPAIWRARGKQMMREAGYKAGLCSGIPLCGGKLKIASSVTLPAIPVEPDSDKLSLALEPESAAVFCKMLTQQQISDYSSPLPASNLNGYILVDIGGGTVDISAYRTGPAPDYAIDLLHQPKGGPFGGSKVNKEFEAFLSELVDDEGFTDYLDDRNEVEYAKHQALLNEIVNDTFEKQKRIFGNKGGRSEASGKVAVRLPHSFFMKYRAVLERKLGKRRDGRETGVTADVELADQTLRIAYSKMETFFGPVVTGICECIKEVLEEVEGIDTVYMVGGFGGCRYIIRTLQQALGTEYNFIVPMHPDLAVISGAALFRHNPAHVNSRRADATFGFRVSVPFDADKHEPKYKAVIQSSGQELCQNIFCTIVERGDVIRTDEVFSSVHPAAKRDLRRMHVDIYSSLEKDVWYTTGLRPSSDSAESEAETRKTDVRKVGELIVPLSSCGTDASAAVREVELFFDFSHAEAQVKGYDHATKNEVKGTIDYLSVSH